MSITNFEITQKLIEPIFNKECIFCFENVNCENTDENTDVSNENKDVNNENKAVNNGNKAVNNGNKSDVKLNMNITKIVLECGHNYHFICFFRYIISKLQQHDIFLILKCKKFECPLCRCKFDYLILDSILRYYVFLLKRDLHVIKKNISKTILSKRYKKFLLFIKNIINKDVYLQEICDYYKSKDKIKLLMKKEKEILTQIYILSNITIY